MRGIFTLFSPYNTSYNASSRRFGGTSFSLYNRAFSLSSPFAKSALCPKEKRGMFFIHIKYIKVFSKKVFTFCGGCGIISPA
jgi:hypothetical protein